MYWSRQWRNHWEVWSEENIGWIGSKKWVRTWECKMLLYVRYRRIYRWGTYLRYDLIQLYDSLLVDLTFSWVAISFHLLPCSYFHNLIVNILNSTIINDCFLFVLYTSKSNFWSKFLHWSLRLKVILTLNLILSLILVLSQHYLDLSSLLFYSILFS